jgi:hypothetical protein
MASRSEPRLERGVAEPVSRERELEARVERLEEANRELRRANAELARSASARTGSGGATALARATEAERTLLRSQGWDEWPRPLRFIVQIALKLRKLRERILR